MEIFGVFIMVCGGAGIVDALFPLLLVLPALHLFVVLSGTDTVTATSIKISDEGNGFDCEKHLHKSEETLVDRPKIPNGRGIYIAAKFDSIEYTNGGPT